MKYIARSFDSTEGNCLGGKARALLRLTHAGFPVPEYFVLTAQAFRDSLTPVQRTVLESNADPAGLQSSLDDLAPGCSVRRELAAALLGLDRSARMLAVRSSALDEDGPEHSFAGQLKSFLGVRPQDVERRVADVWKSGFSAAVCTYRAQHGLPLPPPAPAVIVQEMVDPEASGVAFSADPVSGDRSIAVIASNYGLATSVVSGEADSDLHHVDRAGRIVKRQIAVKTRVDRLSAEAVEGVAPVAVTPKQARAAALTNSQVQQVAAAVRRIEKLFGAPQDVEWALSGGRLYILQARPITALCRAESSAGSRQIWDNSNIVESYGGMTTPLTFSFARRAYEGVYRQFCRTMGVPPAVMEANDSIFVRMIGQIRGRVYYNLLNWYRLIAMLPGYTFNRRFMEQMMGVKEQAELDSIAPARPSFGSRLLDALRLLIAAFRLAANYFRLRAKTAAFQRRLDAALRVDGDGFPGAAPDRLVAAFRDLEQRLLIRWDAPLINDFFTMIFSGVLGRLCEHWGLNAQKPVHQTLLCSGGHMISTEPVRLIADMARLAASDTDLLQVLRQEDASDLMRRLRRFPEFRLKLRNYLERFGERCTDELKLESATLGENPQPLLRAIAALAATSAAKTREVQAQAMDGAASVKDAEARAWAALAGRPLRRWAFAWVLKNARERVRTRENLRYERTRVFGRVRTIFVELGRRFHEIEVLQDPRDIFFLEVDEIFGFVQGYASSTNLKGLVSLRRQEYDEHGRLEKPDDRIETRGIVYHGNRFTGGNGRPDAQSLSGEQRKGIGCGPGIASGRARVVTDPAAARIEPGEILVAERTDPGWVMLFPLASGLVVERGSLLSHSAIVAREMGLPTVVALQGATAWLTTGDLVQVDGNAGYVRRVNPSESEAENSHAQRN
jgi:pyruvate,water dikinase